SYIANRAARVAPEHPIASGSPRGSPRCPSRDAAMLNDSPPEQAFAETLLYLANDWRRLSPEELARLLCERCQSNPQIKAFCRTIKLHFRAKRGGKRNKSGPDKEWTYVRLRALTLDFAIYEIVHPKKSKHWI